jgi:DNA-binding NarL/FixJ family response regulator
MSEKRVDATSVFIVDDHEMVAESLLMALESASDLHAAGRAGSLEEARRRLPSANADVVVVDYRLPDGTGVDLVAELRDRMPSVGFVMVTAFADAGALADALAAGCRGFVAKASGVSSLLGAIRRVAEGELAVSAQWLEELAAYLSSRPAGVSEILSKREREVLDELGMGASTEQIAARLFLSVHTVRNHVHSVLHKLNAHSRLEAVSRARREGLLSRP